MLEARFFASLRMTVWRGFSAARQVKVFDLFVVFLDGAQSAVEEPGLPEFAVGAPGSGVICIERVLPTPSFPRRRESTPFLATWTPTFAGVTR
jgi:hypothetical protein